MSELSVNEEEALFRRQLRETQSRVNELQIHRDELVLIKTQIISEIALLSTPCASARIVAQSLGSAQGLLQDLESGLKVGTPPVQLFSL